MRKKEIVPAIIITYFNYFFKKRLTDLFIRNHIDKNKEKQNSIVFAI